MGMSSKSQPKTKDLMRDPDTRETIQKIATEHGMSIEDAKTHYLRNLE